MKDALISAETGQTIDSYLHSLSLGIDRPALQVIPLIVLQELDAVLP